MQEDTFLHDKPCTHARARAHTHTHTHTQNRLEYAAIAMATHISTSTVEPYL